MYSHPEIMEGYIREFCHAIGCINFAKERGETTFKLQLFAKWMLLLLRRFSLLTFGTADLGVFVDGE